VLLIFYFIVHFSKENKKVRDLVGFIAFFKWALKKRVFYLVRSNYMNPEDNGRFIHFLSQISKLSYFNMLDLADVMMHH